MILDATITSLRVVITAVTISTILSLIAVFVVQESKSKLVKLFDWLMILPLFIPPSAIGYLILIVLGRRGFIGKFLGERFGISIIFTLTAAVIASIVVTIPIMYQSIKSAVLDVDEEIKNAAKICGAGKYTIFMKIVLPISARGILNGIILSFARAFGEFGATILVAGNIPGKTQTLPMALYYAMESNNVIEAKKILLIILGVALILINLYSYFSNTMKHEIIKNLFKGE